MAQDMLQVYRMQYDIKHEELQRLRQDAILQCVCINIHNVDVDRVDERRPKPLCPHRINTLQYTSLLIFFTHTYTATSSSVQLCFKIVFNILILPKFI